MNFPKMAGKRLECTPNQAHFIPKDRIIPVARHLVETLPIMVLISVFLPRAMNPIPGMWIGGFTEWHFGETFFLKLKEFRRVTTRYDKRADRFLAFVHLACIRILLPAYFIPFFPPSG